MIDDRRPDEVSAGGVVVRRDADGLRFLLILDGHGNWGLPKGHVEPGESLADAARREVSEETGLGRLTAMGHLDRIGWVHCRHGKPASKTCDVFLFESPTTDVRLQAEEGIADAAWLPAAQAVERATFDNVKEVLRCAASHLATSTGQPKERTGRAGHPGMAS